jgi:hypothetical protein
MALSDLTFFRTHLVIARRAKPDEAIHGRDRVPCKMDCFVAMLLAMTQ